MSAKELKIERQSKKRLDKRGVFRFLWIKDRFF